MLRNCTAQQDRDFNPLPRKEGDYTTYVSYEQGKRISIHSLVKRETRII